MRIFGKFNDYYDNVVGHDTEGKVWERKTREIDTNFNNFDFKWSGNITQALEESLYSAYKDLPRISTQTMRGRNTVFGPDEHDNMAIVGFCGRLYPVILTKNYEKVLRAFDDFSAYSKHRDLENKDQLDKYGIWGHKPFTERGLNEWRFMHHHKQNDNLFVELNSPIFIIEKQYGDIAVLTVNPDFSKYKLQSVFDPWTAYQEIDMYLNNQLAVTEDPNINRSQELIRDSKGFDDWSFKQKGPKKRKRK